MTIGRNFDNSGNGRAAAIESSIFTTESIICCSSSTEIGRRSKGIFGEDVFVPSGCGLSREAVGRHRTLGRELLKLEDCENRAGPRLSAEALSFAR